jgi:acylphosphatase
LPEIGAHVLIRGLVQGVSFRYYTRQMAEQLGLSGWVRNLADGRVEALFEGEESAVEQMLAWCREGPSAASVEAVEVDRRSASGAHQGFMIQGTFYPG